MKPNEMMAMAVAVHLAEVQDVYARCLASVIEAQVCKDDAEREVFAAEKAEELKRIFFDGLGPLVEGHRKSLRVQLDAAKETHEALARAKGEVRG